ncbi:hypothetical protein FHS68_001527 [Dyadobacter arcticus]|uniref:Uncharacterized protein n=1 Tax=Dyadobacter arcticus TaxID=1078754 RepID=A0ABX0UMR9_9BACT|nr:hypothetical protein [Dyadobacter arcticus]
MPSTNLTKPSNRDTGLDMSILGIQMHQISDVGVAQLDYDIIQHP